MKALTANRLLDGEVVWLGHGDDPHRRWVDTLALARVLDTPEAEARALEEGAAAVADRHVVEPYLIELSQAQSGALVPVRFRERIRAQGPTTRTDLGKQARKHPSAA